MKALHVLEELKVLEDKKFLAMEHTNKCLKAAGWKYMIQVGENVSNFDSNIWSGEDRLKNIV